MYWLYMCTCGVGCTLLAAVVLYITGIRFVVVVVVVVVAIYAYRHVEDVTDNFSCLGGSSLPLPMTCLAHACSLTCLKGKSPGLKLRQLV